MTLEEAMGDSWDKAASGQPMHLNADGTVGIELPEIIVTPNDTPQPAGESGSPDAPKVMDTPLPASPVGQVDTLDFGPPPASYDPNDPKYKGNLSLRSEPGVVDDTKYWITEQLSGAGMDPYNARAISEGLLGGPNAVGLVHAIAMAAGGAAMVAGSPITIGGAAIASLPSMVAGTAEGLHQVADGIKGIVAGDDGAGMQTGLGVLFTALNALGLSQGSKELAAIVGPEAARLISELPRMGTGMIPEVQPAMAAMKRSAMPAAGDAAIIRSTISGKGAVEARAAAEAEVQRIRSSYPESDGWQPLELVGGEMKKGEFIPKWKQPPYNFHTPPEGVTKEAWQSTIANKVVDGVKDIVARAASGDEQAKFILSQASWYRDMRNRLRQEFGGMADLFADLLGTTSAQTNVRTNWDNASEIMRRFSRGEYDKEIANYERAIAAGEDPNKVFSGIRRGYENTGMNKTDAMVAAQTEYPMLTKAAGTLFGTNSPTSAGALVDTFRQIKAGASPKTPNFTGNIMGLTNEATIDVWAARYLAELAGMPRIPPPAEKAVGGKHLVGSSLEDPKVGGEFGFGQKVMKDAAEIINRDGVIPGQTVGPDDLQAVAWFMQKEKWAKAGWTNKAGEGGSLEAEAARAGAANPDRINELRQVINAKGSTAAERAAAQAEYDASIAPVDRTVVGLSGERPGARLSNYGQAEIAAEIDDALKADKNVLMYKATNTYGRFMKQDERALDIEVVTNKGFDPAPLERRVIEMGKQYNQDAVFVSKVLRSADESTNARPGVEIYFSKKQTPDAMRKVSDMLHAEGVDGFTFITDARQADRINVQARAGAPDTAGLTGIRFQYIPEFDSGYSAAQREQIMRRMSDKFDEIANKISDNPDVSSSQKVWYDTKVTFKGDYDERLRTTAQYPGAGSQGGRQPLPADAQGPARAGQAAGPAGARPLLDGQRSAAEGRLKRPRAGTDAPVR